MRDLGARKQASAIIIAEQGRWQTAIIRPLLALPIITYYWKVLVCHQQAGGAVMGLVASMWIGNAMLVVTEFASDRHMGATTTGSIRLSLCQAFSCSAVSALTCSTAVPVN
jgi:hypothetical protein